MTKDENKRKTTWMSQCGECAICLEYQEVVTGMCFVQGKLICRKCNTSLGNYKSALARGVTPEMLAAFLAPEVESVDVESPPEQMFIDGEWCEVINEAWVPMDPQPE